MLGNIQNFGYSVHLFQSKKEDIHIHHIRENNSILYYVSLKLKL